MVRRAGITLLSEYKKWYKVQNPLLPSTPSTTYRDCGWVSWKDFVGAQWREFEEARAFSRQLGVTSICQWMAYTKSEDFPKDIPHNPNSAYKEKGWKGWPDWFGTNKFTKRNARPFQEARAFARSLCFSSQDEWRAWARQTDKPFDIPIKPSRVYPEWQGWGDWLGNVNAWTATAIAAFLKDIAGIIPHLTQAELTAILQRNGLAVSASQSPRLIAGRMYRHIQDLAGKPDAEEAIDALIAEMKGLTSDNEDQETEAFQSRHEADEAQPSIGNLPRPFSVASIHDPDKLAANKLLTDEHVLEFICANRTNALWDEVLNNPDFDIDAIRNLEGGAYANEIRRRFLTQYDGAMALPLPRGYAFHDEEGNRLLPTVMQRLVAYRLLTTPEQGLLNLSGVGAGKTLSAILSSRVLKSKLTLCIGFNSSLDMWERAFNNAFPNVQVFNKDRGSIELTPRKPAVLLLNHESFSLETTDAMIDDLLARHSKNLGLVVVDEAHLSKVSDKVEVSKRRKAISRLLKDARLKHPELRTLTMTATPLVTSLTEPKSLLELTLGRELPELKTTPTADNAMVMHQHLTLYSVRFKPRHSSTPIIHRPEIEANHLLDDLLKIGPSDLLGMDRALLPVKLDETEFRTGDVVYSHYRTGLHSVIRAHLEAQGFKVGVLSGEDHSGLDAYLRGEVQILLGSQPLGCAVDGLQRLSNRMIFLSLPWTASSFEQACGRLNRIGQKKQVEIIIPQVVLREDGKTWSWDMSRWNRIENRQALLDMVLEGKAPEKAVSEKVLLEKARAALREWIAELG